MRYADQLQRECVTGGSAHDVAGHPVRALASWVARRIAGQRERRFMHRNPLIHKDFAAMHRHYDIADVGIKAFYLSH